MRLNSSLRTRSAADTVRAARPIASALGITRLSETTRLDYLGIPVYSAVRPLSATVVVTAGKGLTRDEAAAGALLENIEQAVAERTADTAAAEGRARWLTPRDLAEQGHPRIADWCPRPDRAQALDLDTPLPFVNATAPDSSVVPVPAELVYTPCPQPWWTGLYGSTTTGLASGSTRDEAVLHGLCEVLERDTTSLLAVRDTSALLDPATLPEPVAGACRAVAEAGLELRLRWAPAHGAHYAACLIDDPERAHPLYANGGYGLHPDPAIAVTRAVTEAAQSRLVYIQGSRDDLVHDYTAHDALTPRQLADRRATLLARFRDDTRTAKFGDLAVPPPGAGIRDTLAALAAHIADAGLGPVLVHDFPPLAHPFAVVRVLVPRAEHHTARTRRVGARLLAHTRAETTP